MKLILTWLRREQKVERDPFEISLQVLNLADAAGIIVTSNANQIEFTKGSCVVRIGARHKIYAADVCKDFKHYYGAVEPVQLSDGRLLADYSLPRWHDVADFEFHPIHFPSLPEPVETASQYLNFARIKPGDCVLDLGAYAGLTSILFSRHAGARGLVIAVEPDQQNVASLRKNIAIHRAVGGGDVRLIEGAVWSESGELEFSSEGNMGSSAVTIVGSGRGVSRKVSTLTLEDLANKFELSRVDFIKCDIEGAETAIFNQPEFFRRFKPRILIEAHRTSANETTQGACVSILAGQFGYLCHSVSQQGGDLPLIHCVPG